MNKKYLIMVSIILAILAIGVVSASDDISGDNNLTANPEEEVVVSSVEEIDLSADDSSEVIGEEDERNGTYDYEINMPDSYLKGGWYQVSGNLPGDAEGSMTVDVDDEYVCTEWVWSGYFNTYLYENTNLEAGSHFLKLTYSGDEKYQGFVWNKTFNVDEILINFPDEVQYGEGEDDDGPYMVRLGEGITGDITISFDGEVYKNGSSEDLVRKVIDEVTIYYVPISVNNLAIGQHTYNVTFVTGNRTVTKSGLFNVSYKFKVYTYYQYEDMPYGTHDSLEVTLPEDADGNITVIINGISKEYPASSYEEIPYGGLDIGVNNITVLYSDSKYPERSKKFQINVIGQIQFENTNTPFNEPGIVTLELSSDATGQLCVYNVNDDDSYDLIGNVTLVGGKAKYITNFGLGEFYVLAKYENGNYNVEDGYCSFEVLPIITCPKAVQLNGDANFTMKVPDTATGDIIIKLYKTDSEYNYDDYEDEYTELYNGPIKNLTLALDTSKLGYYAIKIGGLDYLYQSYRFHVINATPEWEMDVDFPDEILSTASWVYPSVNYPDGATGKFTLYIDGEEAGSQYVDSVDGLYDFDGGISNHTLGVHTWRIEFSDDPVFNDASQNGTFNITWAIFPKVIVLGDDSNYVRVGIRDGYGMVTLKVNGEVYAEVDAENGLAEIYLDHDLLPGKDYTYEITCGNLTKSGSFYVDYAIEVTVDDDESCDYLILRDSNELKVIMPDGATGTVSVKVGNSIYSGDIDENGVATIPINLKWGLNSVEITYNGDDVFSSKTITVNCTVSECEVLVKKEDGKFISASMLAPESATGNLTVSIHWDIFKTVKVENGYAFLSLEDLPPGAYYLSVAYLAEDYDFYSREFNGYVAVEPDMNITDKIYEGQDCTVEINLPNATSSLDLYVDGELNGTFAFEDGKLKIVLSDLTLGNHILTFYYEGNDYPNLFHYFDEDEWEYYSIEYNVEVCEKIVPADPNFTITIADVEEGSPITVEVSANENFTGDVIVKVGDYDVLVSVIDGSGVNATDIVLPVGDDYVATLSFDGNDAFNSGSAQTTFNVTAKPKLDPNFVIAIASVVEGTPITVEVSANANFTGDVIVKVGDYDVLVSIKDGEGVNATSIVLPVGDDYVASLNFTGNDAFNSGSAQTTFNVTAKPKYDANLSVSAVDVYESQKVLVTVSINETATGNVTILINGKEEIINITDGKGNYAISDLPAGDYSYTISYSGDEYFSDDAKTVSFTVNPYNARIEIINDVNEYMNGNFTFKVLSNEDNSVFDNVAVQLTFTGMINTAYTAKTDENGIATFKTKDLYKIIFNGNVSRSELEVGKHSVELSISEQGLFAAKIQTELTITPAHIRIVLDDYEEFYGSDKNVEFRVTNVNGEILPSSVFKVEIPDTASGVYYVSTDENGTAKLSVKELYRGTYVIKIRNNDAVNICNETVTGNFTIKGLDAGFSVNASDVYVGENATAIFKINKDFKGYAIIAVGGEDYLLEFINGECKYVFENLKAGDYTFNVGYDGDLRYANGTGTVSFKVNRKSPNFSIEVADVDDKTPITVKVAADSTFNGIVTVKVADKDVIVSVSGGAGVNVTDIVLTPDTYKASLNFTENDEFVADYTQTAFNVTAKPKADPLLTIAVANITEGEIANITITTNSAFTGPVLVVIGQRNVTVSVVSGNGSASVEDLTAGTYTAIATFKETEIFNPSIKNTTFVVNSKGSGESNQTPSGNTKVPAKIVAKDLTAYYYNVKYSVTVYGTDGKVAKGVEVIFLIKGKKVGTAKTNKKGIATIKLKQLPKTYKITSKALGKQVTKTLKIKQVLKLSKVRVKKSADYLVLKATLKEGKKALAGKKITFKFNGKKIKTVKTTKKGVATVTVKKSLFSGLKEGKKVKYQATYKKDTVKKSAVVKK